MATPLFIADAATMDSASSRGDCGFPPTPFGVAIPCATVVVGSGPLMIIPDGTVGTPVPGVGVLCGVVTRTAKVTVNEGKGFVVIEGKVPCLARGLPGSGGDVAEGTPANDNMPGQLRIHTNPGQASQVERIRITKDGYVNIGGQSTQTTHLLHLQSTGDAGIHIRADSGNTDENANPYVSFSQDGGSTAHLRVGLNGDAGAHFDNSLVNAAIVHANNHGTQPLQLAHMTDMAVTISSVSGLGAGGQSATDPRDFDSNGSLSGNAVGGMKIHHYGNDTAAALMLSGHNNTGTPGVETRTQLTHTGANLRFHIEHHGIEAFNIDPSGNIYLKNCSTIPSFTTSYNVAAISLKGGGLMNYQETNMYLLNNMHYTLSLIHI